MDKIYTKYKYIYTYEHISLACLHHLKSSIGWKIQLCHFGARPPLHTVEFDPFVKSQVARSQL